MPWDAGGVPEELERYLATHANGGRVLVPGCGSGYEVRAFAEHGYEVVAIDFSEAAMEKAAEVLGDLKSAVVLGDFFTHDFGEPFDLVYERAFLASLRPRLWPTWSERIAGLVRPGGRLAGYFVYGEQRGGPPYT